MRNTRPALNLKHIAFIMDGNGRWAKQRMLPRSAGHRAGVNALTKTVENCVELGIEYMTFYAFSTENWNRPQKEIDALFDIFREFLREKKHIYKEKDIRIVVLGDITRFPDDMQQAMRQIAEETAECKSACACFAFNYGARDEILLAAKKMNQAGDTLFTTQNFCKYLYTADIPDPDIIVRTSGEMRLSNFLLFQAAYSELYFTKKHWPDFDKRELLRIVRAYNERERRYGLIK